MTVTQASTVRSELVEVIAQELLGPRFGADEEIQGSPRAGYALGALAPVTVDPALAQPDAAERDEDADVQPEPTKAAAGLSDVDPRESEQQGVPVLTDEDVAAAGGEDEEDTGPKGALTHPSSMGLRFQVPTDVTSVAVTASWGRYESFRKEDQETGRKRTWSRRTPFTVRKEIAFDSESRQQTTLLSPDVSLRVETFPMADRTIVELALSNDRVTGMDAPPGDWLFQTELRVESVDGSASFLPTRDVLQPDYDEFDPERRRLDLQYRHRLEYAVGRTCSVMWDERPAERRATSVSTTWLPIADVPQTVAGAAGATVTAMRTLAELEATGVADALEPLADGYSAWLDDREREISDLPKHLGQTAPEALEEARAAAGRLRAGIALLVGGGEALQAFRFMNQAMRDQRIRSQIAAARAATAGVSVEDAQAQVEAKGDAAASWYPFQLAFILMQLPALVDPTNANRTGAGPRAELLFFPTGGGKTEAYLGLAAFTFAIRRLQGTVEAEEGQLDGGDGVAVLMRYTLRLLTSQQFQRATALVCAAEVIRQEDPSTWGERPFRIGLWVGTSVSPKRFAEAREQVMAVKAEDSGRAYGLTVLQVKRCPWCGTLVDPKRDVDAVVTTERIHVYCGDRDGDCPFSRDGRAGEGLPILTVDEEIYRHPPTFLLATVDKFARLAREGEAASIFGYVAEYCPRHGYRHPDARGDACKSQSHNKISKGGIQYDSVSVQSVPRLRPPDLIIQDELHLITGALGTAVGVFENAVDVLCTWRQDDKRIQPLVVASTATIRNTEEQVRRLYGRGVDVFPPQVLDVRDTYFSREIPVDDEHPGRKYLGVCAHGIRLTLAEIRLAEVLLLAGQKLL
ncbi:MAG TPA: helicase, partial [Dehalococcoidia bacterium]|nr:helicase [Dehalococcoidia bacterium]